MSAPDGECGNSNGSCCGHENLAPTFVDTVDLGRDGTMIQARQRQALFLLLGVRCTQIHPQLLELKVAESILELEGRETLWSVSPRELTFLLKRLLPVYHELHQRKRLS